MNIILIAPPGGGKSTQGKKLRENDNFITIIAGDLLRSEKKSGSDLGKKISSIIDKGNLVPDDMITEIIKNEIRRIISESGSMINLLFDGYPRTIKQAISLSKMMNIDKAFLIEIGDDEIVKRILERGKTSGREDDKDESIIRQRIDNYKSETEPLIKYYESENKLIKIDGYKSIEEVNNLIMSNL